MNTVKSYFDDKATNEKNHFEHESANILPSSVAFSWESVTIKAEKTSLKERIRNVFKSNTTNKNYEHILDNVSGFVNSGELLALMGPSGSGKTSLLNALNFQNKNLKVNGRIRINGTEVDSTQVAILSSYVQQEDLFFGTMTVREHLIFHAMLRMDKNITRMAKLRRVNQVLKEFNLEKSADVVIGIHGKTKGISGGEKKRLSFATEILTDPPLLFCDEPTSGLDSFMAKSIIHYLKKLADLGKTIICTIHQPSSETFRVFDKICVLSEKKVAFFGSKENAYDFFTKSLHLEFPAYTNPADFYMDTLGIDTNDLENSRTKVQKYCEIFAKSQYNQELVEKIRNVPVQPFNLPKDFKMYNSTWSDQFKYLSQRSFSNYFKNYHVMVSNFVVTIVISSIGAIIYYNTGHLNKDGTCSFDQRSIRETAFAIFYALFAVSVFSVLSAILIFPLEIPVYLKEHRASVYRSDTYYLSKLLTEIPSNIIFSTLSALMLYYCIVFGCTAHNFFMFLFIIIMTAIGFFSLGHVFSVLSKDVTMAISLATPVLCMQLLFSGFFLNEGNNHPRWLDFFRNFSIFHYSYELMYMNQWGNVGELKCEYDIELLCISTGEEILKKRDISKDGLAYNIIMLLVLTIVCRLITYFLLWTKGKRNSFSFRQEIIKKRDALVSV